MDLDFWDCFGRKQTPSFNQRNIVTPLPSLLLDILYFFGYKAEVFSLPKNLKTLDQSFKTSVDFCDCFWKEKYMYRLIAEFHKTDLYILGDSSNEKALLVAKCKTNLYILGDSSNEKALFVAKCNLLFGSLSVKQFSLNCWQTD